MAGSVDPDAVGTEERRAPAQVGPALGLDVGDDHQAPLQALGPVDRQQLDAVGLGRRGLVEAGAVRLNRQPVEKAHARLRAGDVLTLALGGPEHGRIQVWRVLSLAQRRGPAPEARRLYEELVD